ncbi:MAG: hypothetical protein V1855_00335 [bacterium]
MLKPQDCVVLLKLLANPDSYSWPQRKLSDSLCISLSEINASMKRLFSTGLIREDLENGTLVPNLDASYEFLVHGLKYCFPVKLGKYSRGIPTGVAAPIFKDQFADSNEPISIWPYFDGNARGMVLEPLYKSVPKSIKEHPDLVFYNLLSLVDVIRGGRAREKGIALKLLESAIIGQKRQ